MPKVNTVGTVEMKKILKQISKKEGIKLTEDNLKYNRGDLSIHFTKEVAHDVLGTVTESHELNQVEIIKEVNSYLADKNIKHNKVSVNTEHVDGDSREMMDYGYTKVIGFKFDLISY